MKSFAIGMIPVHLESKRLARKALLPINNEPLIIRVAKRALLSSRLSDVYVCTDSIEILELCEKENIKTILTGNYHVNGTERIAEAVAHLTLPTDTIIVDIQGDEAFVTKDEIDTIVETFDQSAYDIFVPHQILEERSNKNRVKIVESNGRILYMSRSDIPYSYGSISKLKKHHSIVAFKREVLLELVESPATPLEIVEGIELMRAIELGYSIGTCLLPGYSISIDTEEDYLLGCRLASSEKST